MIQVRAALTVIADSDEAADAYLREMLTPRKGLTIRVNEASRELYGDEIDLHATEGEPG